MNAGHGETVDDVLTFVLPAGPYPGLRPFDKNEWPIFFGRERMADEVIGRLIDHRFLMVHGDSGCGKSSLIRAGVLPQLEQNCARAGARWLTCAITPGDEPLGRLAVALAGLHGEEQIDTRTLEIRRILNCGRDGAAALADYLRARGDGQVCILIDQFEELFAHARRRGPQQSSLLVDLLIGLQKLAPPNLCVVCTMRSEFLGACAQFRGFAQVVNTTQYLLPRMEHADLMRAIREPAPLYDGEIAPDLAERLIADAGGSQDQLPLIQHGLMLLHRDCVRRADGSWRLTLEAYRSPGKLGQLLSDHADDVMNKLEPATPSGDGGSRVTEDLFRALTEINADGQATRNPRRLRDLIAVTGAAESALRQVVDAFRVDGVSFLRPYGQETIGQDDYVDISHEALIRCWGRIADPANGWLIREFKHGLIWRSLLVQADSFEQDPSNVLSPATSEERQVFLRRRNSAWSERYGGGWTRVERLIEASVSERDRQIRQEIEERSREQRAKFEEEQAKLRERELTANLTAAVEKGRRAAIFRWAFLLSVVLLSVAGYFWWKASAAGIIAVRETENARVAADTIQKNFDEAEAKRRLAEESLAKIKEQLAELKQASAAAPVDSKIKQQIDRAESAIALQVNTLSFAARSSPRIYLHIADESQRDAARRLELRIEATRPGDLSVVVPGIQRVDSAPKYSLLRCFTAEDCKLGPELLELVNAQLASPKVQLQDFSRSYTGNAIRPQHFELYFAPGPIKLAGAPASAR
jgi:hypothetical protein